MTTRFREETLKVFANTGLPFIIHKNALFQLCYEVINTTTTTTTTTTSTDGNGSDEFEVNLRSWNEATVERLVEYAYTRDYHCPDPTPLDTPTVTPGPSSESGLFVSDNGNDSKNQSSTDVPPPPPKCTSAASTLARPLTPLNKCFHAGPDPRPEISQAAAFRAKSFDPTTHDFECVFLAHAQIYSLARHLEIEPLWTLALQRLMRTLMKIGTVNSNWPVVSNFAELVRFSYEKTSDPQDPLRRIISQFAAINFTSFQTEDMKGCIKDCGEFASELMEKVCRRLIVSEQRRRDEENKIYKLENQLTDEERTSNSLVSQLENGRIELESLKSQLKNEKNTSAGLRQTIELLSKPPAPTPTASGTKPFGCSSASGSTGSLFGNSTTSKPPASTGTSGLFGSTSTSKPTVSTLFGSTSVYPNPDGTQPRRDTRY